MCRLLLAVLVGTDLPDKEGNWLSRQPDGMAPSPGQGARYITRARRRAENGKNF
jgi:hypothetical protein